MYIIKLINTEEEIMKLKLNIDSKYSEKEVHIFADKVDDKINQIINICNKKEKFKLFSIKDEKYLVVMKYYKNTEEVLNKLEEKGFKYVCVKRAYREGQEILRTREEILNSKDYMSIIIANKK